MLAITNDQSQRPTSIIENQPSNWREHNHTADLLIVAHSSLLASARQLQTYRESQGLRVALVDIEDVYDEFTFGNKSPYALRDFLAFAKANWQLAPRFVLLVGDASLDPRNYLGRGDADLVPTKLLDTRYMETASDDWFAEIDSDGQAKMSVGRLPVRAEDEALRMISKIIGYERSTGGNAVLLVSDINDGFNFEAVSNRLREILPSDTRVEQINRESIDDSTAKKALLAGLSRGQKVVNYIGHGSLDSWRGNLLSSAEARGLTNSELPLFVMMTCLNGYFQDASLESLAESLMKAERGGAIAVWASSGLTIPSAQSAMTQRAFETLFDDGDGRTVMLGEVTSRAKDAVHDSDVRRTWILFGDPTTRIKRQ